MAQRIHVLVSPLLVLVLLLCLSGAPKPLTASSNGQVQVPQLRPRSVLDYGDCYAATPADYCSSRVQNCFLLYFFFFLGNGPYWLNRDGWADAFYNNASKPCHHTAANGLRLALPSHCCFFGVSCCTQPVCAPNEPNPYNCNCTFGLVTNVTLDYNNVTGRFIVAEIPQVVDSLACSLRVLSFLNNSITGTIPTTISNYSRLSVLGLGYNNFTGTIPTEIRKCTQLQEFDVQHNRLSGTVPFDLCGFPDRPSKLIDVALGGNMLTGALNLSTCASLIYLEASGNNFDGPLINTSAFNQLHILRLSDNNITGPLSTNFAQTRRLSLFNVANNRLTGTVPTDFNKLPYLQQVKLSNNLLTGTLPSTLFDLGSLTLIDISQNNLTGYLPGQWGSSSALTTMNLTSNGFYGTIPESMAQFARSRGVLVDLRGNRMSCCVDGLTPEGVQIINASRPKLPTFMAFSKFYEQQISLRPEDNFENLLCPAFIIAGLPDAPENMLNWYLDPVYFLYEGCQCTHGFNKVNVTLPNLVNFTLANNATFYNVGWTLKCVLQEQPWYITSSWAIAIIIVGTIALICVFLWVTMLHRGGRPLMQALHNLRKRIDGEPRSGVVTVVITDIEGFSVLFKKSPELMSKALKIHNNLIRRARWKNYGYTIEQEGDSYSLIFSEAMDAVSFCLQTQQALQNVTWPVGLFPNPDPDGAFKRRKGSLRRRILQGLRDLGTRVSSGAADGSQAKSSDSTDRGVTRDSDNSMVSPDPSLGSSQSQHVSHVSQARLFNGLRVRMGCATVDLGSSSKAAESSEYQAVVDMAKVISDAGAGGQVFMDANTFMNIKERLEELGAVDENGFNHTKLLVRRKSWWLCRGKVPVNSSLIDAPVLDMGEYFKRDLGQAATLTSDEVLAATHGMVAHQKPVTARRRRRRDSTNRNGRAQVPCCQPSTADSGISHFQSSTVTVLTDGPSRVSIPEEPLPTARTSRSLLPALRDGVSGVSANSNRQYHGQRLRLYQIMAPSLAGRAAVFGNKLFLKDSWQCIDAPYFTAPGAAEAPLGPYDGPPVEHPLVTMVFSSVDGARLLRRDEVKAVHLTIASAIYNTIRLFEGGYSVRTSEADLKYMTVFSDPQAALTWCLTLQEVLIYAEWPEGVLRHEQCREEIDSEGRLVFRGPRLKMGLCEGRPESITPDHMGRADYHGSCINQAARFMDAGAHGGQVVCEETMAVMYLQTISAGSMSVGHPASLPDEADLQPYSPVARYSHPAQHPAVAAAIAASAALAVSQPGSPRSECSDSMLRERLTSASREGLEAVVENDLEGGRDSSDPNAVIDASDLLTLPSPGAPSLECHIGAPSHSNHTFHRSATAMSHSFGPFATTSLTFPHTESLTESIAAMPTGNGASTAAAAAAAAPAPADGYSLDALAEGEQLSRGGSLFGTPAAEMFSGDLTTLAGDALALAAMATPARHRGSGGGDGEKGDGFASGSGAAAAAAAGGLSSTSAVTAASTTRGSSYAARTSFERPPSSRPSTTHASTSIERPTTVTISDIDDAFAIAGSSMTSSIKKEVSFFEAPRYLMSGGGSSGGSIGGSVVQMTAPGRPPLVPPTAAAVAAAATAAQQLSVLRPQMSEPLLRSALRKARTIGPSLLGPSETSPPVLRSSGGSMPRFLRDDDPRGNGGQEWRTSLRRLQTTVLPGLVDGGPFRGATAGQSEISGLAHPSAMSTGSPASSSDYAPADEYRTHIQALRIGVFRFKGSPDDLPMVQVVTTALARRFYPPDPPKGKGARVSESNGVVMTRNGHRVEVVMPSIILEYKARHKQRRVTPGHGNFSMLMHTPSFMDRFRTYSMQVGVALQRLRSTTNSLDRVGSRMGMQRSRHSSNLSEDGPTGANSV